MANFPSAEFNYIEWLRQELLNHEPNRRLLIPPGDDTALEEAPRGGLLSAADMLMDGVHFDLRTTAAQLVGRKALAVNLSDIAAMAGTPRSVTVCLALPRRGGDELAKNLLRGMLPLARQFDVAIAGGDTNSWDGPLVISVAVTGEPHPLGSVERRGAKAGDWLCVSGKLGGSLSGKHLSFTPRLAEAQRLRSDYGVTSMLDLSDGLASDLRHILSASGVGASLSPAHIPTQDGAIDASALTRALSDGEDFELCFTLPANQGRILLATQPFAPELLISHIGDITAARSPALTWDTGEEITARGWSHGFD